MNTWLNELIYSAAPGSLLVGEQSYEAHQVCDQLQNFWPVTVFVKCLWTKELTNHKALDPHPRTEFAVFLQLF